MIISPSSSTRTSIDRLLLSRQGSKHWISAIWEFLREILISLFYVLLPPNKLIKRAISKNKMINNRVFSATFFCDHFIFRLDSCLCFFASDIKTVWIHQEVVDIHNGNAFFCLICRCRGADNAIFQWSIYVFLLMSYLVDFSIKKPYRKN